MKSKMIAAVAALASLQGCATITRGTTEVLVVDTQPPGANVRIDPAGISCTTPCSVELKRKKDVIVQIEKAGYEPVKVSVLSEIAGAGAAGMAGNALIGGLIGVAVDAASGATKKLTPNPIKLVLAPVAAATTPSPPQPDAQAATQQ